MSITVSAPVTGQRQNSQVKTFADQFRYIADPVDGVSPETMQLLIEASAKMEPLMVEVRNTWRLTEPEIQMVTDRMVALITQVYEESGEQKEVGFELMYFAIRRLGYKFKALCGFSNKMESRYPGSSRKIVAMVGRQALVDPRYKGSR